jgi:hypothetical protein
MKSNAFRFFIFSLLFPLSIYGQSKIWGITNKGGSGTIGTVYNTDNDGTNQALLNEFAADNPGSKPFGDLIEINGKLYGLTSEAGTSIKELFLVLI